MATATGTQTRQTSSARVHVQKFGTFLSNMVMPNIGAFIAWGFITALFIAVGWYPVDRLGGFGVDAASCVTTVMNQAGETVDLPAGVQACKSFGGLVGPMITYLLPLLIGFTGGFNIYGHRGGVVGAIATMGIIAGTSIPMFMGAMMMGPLGGWTMKKLDNLWSHKIPPGFEMLINNFAAGIWGMILAVFGFYVMSPIVSYLADVLGKAVETLVNNGLLPLTSILIEPAKILFLNNAINHGVLTPLGIEQASGPAHKSILFLLEANPGPGLGLLLAYMLFAKGAAKASAPGAAIIHFLGGIHEIYFPYVLMRPVLIIPMICAGATGVLVNSIFDVGLRAPAAPGSILAVYAQTASGSYLGVTLSWIAAAAVSFALSAFFLNTGKADEGDLAAATASMEAMKGKKSSVSSMLTGDSARSHGPIKNIVFACDAGMGSSAMGASVLRKKIQAAGFNDVTVINKAISTLTDTFDLVVSHQDLTPRAKERTGSAIHVSVDNFMGSPRYDEIVEMLRQTNSPGGAAAAAASAAPAATAGGVLADSSIVLEGKARDKAGAITEAGELLVAAGAVDAAYVDAMHEREKSVSTYMGNLLAIPHGTNEAKSMIKRSAISIVRYPYGIDWNGKQVKFVIGIAGAGNDHMALLGKIAEVFLDKEQVADLERATSASQVSGTFGGVNA